MHAKELQQMNTCTDCHVQLWYQSPSSSQLELFWG